MNVDKVVQYWLTSAPDDLSAAEDLLKGDHYLQALFLGHLYLEKLLKALVVHETGEHAPLTHNLRFLAEKGGSALTAEQGAFFARITEYNIKTRYPDMALELKRQFTRELCQAELNEIKESGEWIKKKVTS